MIFVRDDRTFFNTLMVQELFMGITYVRITQAIKMSVSEHIFLHLFDSQQLDIHSGPWSKRYCLRLLVSVNLHCVDKLCNF